MSGLLRRSVRRVRNSTPVIRLLSLKNTYCPVPVARVGKRIVFGRRIVEVEARPWRDAISHDWTLYTKVDETAQVLLDELTRVTSRDDRILDICCNVGRHLNYLANHGYEDLTGFDVMKSAITRAPLEFPSLRRARLVHASAPEFFHSCPDEAFDWAFTHSATIELIHPSFRVEQEIFRTVSKGAVLLLSPTGHKYPRDFARLFERTGFHVESTPLGARHHPGLVLLVLTKCGPMAAT